MYPATVVMRMLKKQGKLTKLQAKFLKDSRPAEEFYDLKSDPEETKNLINSIQYADIVEEFRSEMEIHLERFDTRNLPESEATVNEIKQSRHKWYLRKLKAYNVKRRYKDSEYLKFWENRLGVNSL